MRKPTRSNYLWVLLAFGLGALVAGSPWSEKPTLEKPLNVEKVESAPDSWRLLQKAVDQAPKGQNPSPRSDATGVVDGPQPNAEALLTKDFRAVVGRVLGLEGMAPHQVDIRAVSCKERTCNIDLQLPPFVAASVRRDNKVASDLLDELRSEFGKQGAQVALTRLDHAKEGMAISVQVEAELEKGRYLTDHDIAKIRAETIQEYLKVKNKSGD